MAEVESKNKKIIFIIILLLMLVAAVIFAIKFLALSETDSGGAAGSGDKAVNIKVKLDKLDTEILKSAEFIKLKEYKVNHSEINDLEIGKENPFESN